MPRLKLLTLELRGRYHALGNSGEGINLETELLSEAIFKYFRSGGFFHVLLLCARWLHFRCLLPFTRGGSGSLGRRGSSVEPCRTPFSRSSEYRGCVLTRRTRGSESRTARFASREDAGFLSAFKGFIPGLLAPSQLP